LLLAADALDQAVLSMTKQLDITEARDTALRPGEQARQLQIPLWSR
jgi:hypothetical protein